jgi:hypothetical protein
MAGKGKKKCDPAVEHLNELQITEMPAVVWEFLVSKAGGEEYAAALTEKQIHGYAVDFLDSDNEGRSYWPLSENIPQWQYEITHPEVWEYLSKLMLEEARKRPTPTFNAASDVRPTSSGGGHKRTPKQGRDGRFTASKADTKSSNPRTSPVMVATPRNRAMSPTVAPDIAYELEETVPTPSKKTRTPSKRSGMANVPFEKPQATSGQDSERFENASSSRGLGLLRSPVRAGKRPIERDDEFEMSGALGISSPERPPKRVALSPPPESSTAPQPSVIIPSLQGTEPAALSDPAPSSPTQNRNEGETFTDVPCGDSSSSLVPFRGLHYTAQNLSRIPQSILDYVEECGRHQLRLARGATEPSMKDKHRAQSTLFNNLRADLESRIVCLSEDAAERDRVESSYCLWN